MYYYSDGETIAEFDAIFKIRDCQYFVEITDTTSNSNVSSLRYEIQRKKNVLTLLFPSRVICWIITSYAKKIDLEGLTDTVVLTTPKYDFEFDFNSLRTPNNLERLDPPKSTKFVTVDSLHYQPFSYFKLLGRIQKEFEGNDCDQIRQKLPEVMSPFLGLVERVFLGKMSFTHFNSIANLLVPKGKEYDQVYLALKVKDLFTWPLAIYLTNREGELFEYHNESTQVKMLEPRKRSTVSARETEQLKHTPSSRIHDCV